MDIGKARPEMIVTTGCFLGTKVQPLLPRLCERFVLSTATKKTAFLIASAQGPSRSNSTADPG